MPAWLIFFSIYRAGRDAARPTHCSESSREVFDAADGVARDEQFFVCRDHNTLTRAFGFADSPSLSTVICAFRASSISIPSHPSFAQMRWRMTAEFSPIPPVNTRASAPAHFGQIRADVLSDALAEKFRWPVWRGVLIFALFFDQFTHVVGQS